MRKPSPAVALITLVLLSAAIAYSAAKARQEEQGPWLIVNGRLVDPPWTFDVLNDVIHVNGEAFRLPRPDAPDVSQTVMIKHGVLARLFERAAEWRESMDDQTVRERARDHLDANEPAVASAILDGEIADIRIEWTHTEIPSNVSLRAPTRSQSPTDPQAALFETIAAVEDALATPRSLVIVTDGGLQFTPPPTGGELLAWILDVIRDVPGFDARVQLLRTRVFPLSAAEMIARNMEATK
jgi:hypothetical protein